MATAQRWLTHANEPTPKAVQVPVIRMRLAAVAEPNPDGIPVDPVVTVEIEAMPERFGALNLMVPDVVLSLANPAPAPTAQSEAPAVLAQIKSLTAEGNGSQAPS